MTKFLKIHDIPELCISNCRIKNPERVAKLLNELVDAGHEKLQIVSDFDFTITKQHLNNGQRMVSSFCILDMCKSLPKHCHDESRKLVAKFRPIEIDPHISIQDKIKAMEKWWELSSALHK